MANEQITAFDWSQIGLRLMESRRTVFRKPTAINKIMQQPFYDGEIPLPATIKFRRPVARFSVDTEKVLRGG